jgi:hypothetical protein
MINDHLVKIIKQLPRFIEVKIVRQRPGQIDLQVNARRVSTAGK